MHNLTLIFCHEFFSIRLSVLEIGLAFIYGSMAGTCGMKLGSNYVKLICMYMYDGSMVFPCPIIITL